MGVVKLIGFGALCFAGWYVYRLINADKKKTSAFSPKSSAHKRLQRPTTQQPPLNRSGASSVQPANETQHVEIPGKNWFQNQMLAYKKKMLAYCVSQAAWKINVSATSIISLQEKYGRVTLKPSLAEFEVDFKEQGLSAKQLEEVGIDWLACNGIKSNTADWENQIESFALQQCQKEAELIIQQVK